MKCGPFEFVTQCLRLEAHWLSGDGAETGGMVALVVMRPVTMDLFNVRAG